MARNDEGPPGAHAKLLANGLAQAEALMVGRSEAESSPSCTPRPGGGGDRSAGAPARLPRRPALQLILLERLTPACLGALIALYEHKVFVEGVIWGINSFDQWGVELGKTLAARILPSWKAGRVRGTTPRPPP